MVLVRITICVYFRFRHSVINMKSCMKFPHGNGCAYAKRHMDQTVREAECRRTGLNRCIQVAKSLAYVQLTRRYIASCVNSGNNRTIVVHHGCRCICQVACTEWFVRQHWQCWRYSPQTDHRLCGRPDSSAPDEARHTTSTIINSSNCTAGIITVNAVLFPKPTTMPQGRCQTASTWRYGCKTWLKVYFSSVGAYNL